MLSVEAGVEAQSSINDLHGRLIIEKIVVDNFKSYAGRQEIGPFHKVSCRQW